MKINGNTFAIFLSLMAVLLWSTVATAFKIALSMINYFQLLFYSSLISLLIFTVVMLYQKKFTLLRTYGFKSVLNSILLGVLNPFLYYIVLFAAYSKLLAQEALILNYTWAIVIAVLSIFILKQKFRLMSFIAISISFLGVVVIVTKANFLSFQFSNPKGIMLALGSSIIWGLFWVLNTKDKKDEIVKLFLNFLSGFILTAIINIITKNIFIPNCSGLLAVTYIGFFEMGITFILWLYAMKHAKSTATISNLIFLSPFLSLLFISLILKEKIELSSIFGLILIITGIVIQNIRKLSLK